MMIFSSSLRDCVNGDGHGFLKLGRKKDREVSRFLARHDGEPHPESSGAKLDGRSTGNAHAVAFSDPAEPEVRS
jgi:hypothetical protein